MIVLTNSIGNNNSDFTNCNNNGTAQRSRLSIIKNSSTIDESQVI
jgi:hypothetical protein